MKLVITFSMTILLFLNCGPTKTFTNSLGMVFVYIEPGTFTMGDDNGKDSEKPAHQVTISQGFHMQNTEVTVGQFKKFIKDTDYITTAEKEDGTYVLTDQGYQKREDANWRNPHFSQDDNHPVVCVSWNDANAFVKWLSEKTDESYRLPTEAEWEYACRAGSAQKYFWGDSLDDNYLWYKENSNMTTHPVGSKLPNAWGLYDMIGNVMEPCSDIYSENYYESSPSLDPQGPSSDTERVARGGCWYSDADYCRCTVRLGGEPTVRSPMVGFRIAMSKN